MHTPTYPGCAACGGPHRTRVQRRYCGLGWHIAQAMRGPLARRAAPRTGYPRRWHIAQAAYVLRHGYAAW